MAPAPTGTPSTFLPSLLASTVWPPRRRLQWLTSEGDLEIVDAQPLPASKAQCKNGGWRNFPDFKNQGQCVSFVATGGEKRP